MVRNGLRGRFQIYKCKTCGRKFTGGNRRDKQKIISDYIDGKQTIEQLSNKYGVSARTIRRDLSDMRYVQKISRYKQVSIQLDTTYWGRGFGLMAIKDSVRKKILWHKYVSHETISAYMEGVTWLRDQGFKIYGVVIDGLQGLHKALFPLPVQMCQFHQIQIIKRYLTNEPEIEASRKLLKLAKNLTKTDKESFNNMFAEWYNTYQDVLNERVHDRRFKRNTPPFMRPKLRSAYLSLKRNMPRLWTFYDHPELGLPNTNNSLEGIFTDLKTKLRVHSGIKRDFRRKI